MHECLAIMCDVSSAYPERPTGTRENKRTSASSTGLMYSTNFPDSLRARSTYISFDITLNDFWWFGVTISELRRVGAADAGLRGTGIADIDCRREGPWLSLTSSNEMPSISHSSFCA